MRSVLGGLLLLFFVGCGGAGSLRQPLSGKVVLQGTAVDNGTINLYPTGETNGPVAFAAIQNGQYWFTTETGPHVGSHRVEIDLNHQTPAEVAKAATNIKDIKNMNSAGAPPAVEKKTRWVFDYAVPSKGELRKDFDLQP